MERQYVRTSVLETLAANIVRDYPDNDAAVRREAIATVGGGGRRGSGPARSEAWEARFKSERAEYAQRLKSDEPPSLGLIVVGSVRG